MAFATTPIAIDMIISGLRFERIPRLTRVGKELQRGKAGFRDIIVRVLGVCKCMFSAHEKRIARLDPAAGRRPRLFQRSRGHSSQQRDRSSGKALTPALFDILCLDTICQDMIGHDFEWPVLLRFSKVHASGAAYHSGKSPKRSIWIRLS